MVKKISLLLIISLAAFNAQADTQRANYDNPPSSEETAGFVSGAVIGVLTGGPAGAIVGGAIGAVIGDGWHARGKAADLQVSLYESQLQLAVLKEETQAVERRYQLAQQELDRMRSVQPQVLPAYASTTAAACCDNTVVSIHFRTGSSSVEDHYEEQLESLARIASQMPAASIEITGYADRNGDAEKNLALSRQRSSSVKNFFNSKGIENSSISTIAYGETRPLETTQSFESDFFDRRVIVRLRDNSKSMLSQTPDGQ